MRPRRSLLDRVLGNHSLYVTTVAALAVPLVMATPTARADVDVELPNRAVVTGTLAATPIPDSAPPTYRVELPAGARLSVVATSRSGGRRRATARLGLELLDDGGTDLADGAARSRGARTLLRTRIGASGTYRIRVTGADDKGGDYSLSVRWKTRRRIRFTSVAEDGGAEAVFAADHGQHATIVVRPARRSGAVPRLVRVETADGGSSAPIGAPSDPDARIHRANDVALPGAGDLVLRLADLGSGGAVAGVITLRGGDEGAELDLTDDVLGESHGGGAIAFGRLVGPGAAVLTLHETTGGALAGTSLAVPEGALAQSLPLFVGSSDDIVPPDSALLPAGPTVLVGPDDTLLAEPATLTIPFDRDAGGSVASQIRVLQQSGDATQVLTADDGILVDTAAGTVTLSVRRLGRFRVVSLGEPPPIESDLDGDGHPDLIVRAPNSDTGRGALFIHFGPLSTDTNTAAASTTIRCQEIEAYFGFQYVAADLDGDGRSELVVSQESAEFGDGAVHVFANVGRGQDITTQDAIARFSGVPGSGETFGISLAVGDVNDDGTPDVLIGAENAGPNSHGRAYVFLGDPEGVLPFAGERFAPDADCRIFGESPGDLLGSSVAIGDVTGDGVADIVVAADQALRSAFGQVFVFAGPLTSESLFRLDAAVALSGESIDSGFGLPLTCGDADGDGIDDILVAATNQNVVEPTLRIGAGRAYLFYGGESLLALGTLSNASAADLAIDGQGEFDALGQDLRIGDVTGDGVADVIVGTAYDSSRRFEAGSVAVHEGSRIRGQIPTTPTTVLHGAAARDTLYWIEPVIDLNGDGAGDLITLAPGNGAGGRDAGACYVIFGGATPEAERRVDLAASGAQGFTVLGAPGEFLGEASLFFDF